MASRFPRQVTTESSKALYDKVSALVQALRHREYDFSESVSVIKLLSFASAMYQRFDAEHTAANSAFLKAAHTGHWAIAKVMLFERLSCFQGTLRWSRSRRLGERLWAWIRMHPASDDEKPWRPLDLWALLRVLESDLDADGRTSLDGVQPTWLACHPGRGDSSQLHRICNGIYSKLDAHYLTGSSGKPNLSFSHFKTQETALMMASRAGHMSILKLIRDALQAEAQSEIKVSSTFMELVEDRSASGRNAAMFAAEEGHTHVLWFIWASSDPRHNSTHPVFVERTPRNTHCLSHAVVGGHFTTVRFLVECVLEPNLAGFNDFLLEECRRGYSRRSTALLAFQYGHVRIFEFLLSKGFPTCLAVPPIGASPSREIKWNTRSFSRVSVSGMRVLCDKSRGNVRIPLEELFCPRVGSGDDSSKPTATLEEMFAVWESAQDLTAQDTETVKNEAEMNKVNEDGQVSPSIASLVSGSATVLSSQHSITTTASLTPDRPKYRPIPREISHHIATCIHEEVTRLVQVGFYEAAEEMLSGWTGTDEEHIGIFANMQQTLRNTFSNYAELLSTLRRHRVGHSTAAAVKAVCDRFAETLSDNATAVERAAHASGRAMTPAETVKVHSLVCSAHLYRPQDTGYKQRIREYDLRIRGTSGRGKPDTVTLLYKTLLQLRAERRDREARREAAKQLQDGDSAEAIAARRAVVQAAKFVHRSSFPPSKVVGLHRAGGAAEISESKKDKDGQLNARLSRKQPRRSKGRDSRASGLQKSKTLWQWGFGSLWKNTDAMN